MNKTVHFSIDDISSVLRWIKDNKPQSIFDTRFFGTLKIWHLEYGLKCTLYFFTGNTNFVF